MVFETWDKVADEVNFNLEIDRERFVGIIDRKAKVLDFGCGYGRIANELAECGYANVTGIDPSSAMIERGHRMYPNLSIMCLENFGLPFDDGSFDAVVACAVLTCIPSQNEREGVISEIMRVLRPDGFFHVSEFCADKGKLFTSGMGIAMRYSSPREFRILFSGFSCLHAEVVSAETMNGYGASSYRGFFQKLS